MPTIRPEGNRAGGAYASQVGGRQPARGNYPVEPAAPDSERAITTAARAEELLPQSGNASLRELVEQAVQSTILEGIEVRGRGAQCNLPAVVDAVLALIERRHQEVEQRIRALPTHNPRLGLWTVERRKVIEALLGESTQEQASE